MKTPEQASDDRGTLLRLLGWARPYVGLIAVAIPGIVTFFRERQ